MQKYCPRCEQTKELEEFNLDARRVHGRQSHCRACRADYRQSIPREVKREKDREYRKRWEQNNPGARAKVLAQWRARNPAANIAHEKLRYAVSRGHIVPADKCSECGSTENIHGHHENYDNPLEITWLCAVCHGRLQAYATEGRR